MQLDDALRVLGLGPDASWDAVRRAHRRAIVRAHPDRGGDPDDAARVNQAFDLLSLLTHAGREPLRATGPPPPPSPTPVYEPAAPARTVPLDDPADVVMRLADAAHEIGEVVFVDPQAGLLEVVVGEAPAVGQLTASTSEPGPDGVPVAFTLEPLGITPAPPIQEVVASLMRELRRRSPSGFPPPPGAARSPR